MTNVRECAVDILLEIEKNNSYSNIAIGKFLRNSNMDSLERGFLTQLVYGVIEKKYFLEYVISLFSKMNLNKLDDKVFMILKLGVYQIYFLDGVKDFAAVNETVNLAKKDNKSATGFINGVLRSVLRKKTTISLPDRSTDLINYLSVKYSFAKWMINRWIESFGEDFTEDLLESLSEKPKMYIRVNTLKTTIDYLEGKLKENGIETSRVPFLKEALEVKNLKNIENNEMFKEGLFSIQDLSSMLVANILNPLKDSTVLDCCSAPGGKATHIAEKMNNTGFITARDIFDHKIKLIENSITRLGITNIKTENINILNDETVDEKYDYVLVDAPCSGFGIIRRKPEIKYKSQDEIKQLPKLQFELISKASKSVKNGGILVYSTCTIEENENLNIINAFLKRNPDFKFEKIDNVNIDHELQNKGYLEIYPNIHDMDGFFIAKLRKDM